MNSFKSFLYEATTRYNPQLFDPALMTWQEFLTAINPSCKSHSSTAYNYPLSKFDDTKTKYPTLLYRKLINGINFEFRVKKIDRYKEEQFVKIDPETHIPVKIHNTIQYHDHKRYYLHQFGTDNQKLKEFMFKLALSWVKEDDSVLKIYDHNKDLLNSSMVNLPTTLKGRGLPSNLKPFPVQVEAYG